MILHCLFCIGQIGLGLDWVLWANRNISQELFVSEFEQHRCLERSYCIPKPFVPSASISLYSICASLCLIPFLRPPHPLVQQRVERFSRREFDLFNSWTRRPSAFSCQALAEVLKHNSTLTNLNLVQNWIADEGAKAWCLVRMV